MIDSMMNEERKTLPGVTRSMMTTVSIGIWRKTGQVFPFPVNKLRVFCVLFGLCGVAAFLDWVVRPCTGLCNALLQEWPRKSSFQTLFCHFLPYRSAYILFVHAHSMSVILEEALHDRSATVLLCGISVISCSFECFSILLAFHSVDPIVFSSMLNREGQERTWGIDCWFVALPASWHLR